MAGQPVDIVELLDLDYRGFADDLSFYENLARHCGGPVLELGAGTGRVAIALAQAGFEVSGIDTSEEAIAFARCQAGAETARLHLVRADMRDFDLGRQFDLIFAGFGAFHHLPTDDDQLGCLRSVRRHLAPGGLFVCDLRAIDATEWDEGESAPLLHDWTRTLPRTGETVMKFRAVRADRARQLQHELHIYDRIAEDGTVRRTTVPIELRFTSRAQMEALLRDAGLELDRMYGDFDLSPYDDASDYMITVARCPLEAA